MRHQWLGKGMAVILAVGPFLLVRTADAAVDINGRFRVTATMPLLGTFVSQWDIVQTGMTLTVSALGSPFGAPYMFPLTGTIDPDSGVFTLTDTAPFCLFGTPGSALPGTVNGTATSDDAFGGTWTSYYYTFPFLPCLEFTGTFSGERSACGLPEELCDETDPCCVVTCDAFQPAGTACTGDSFPCTDDVCDGAGTCAHPVKSAGPVCRPSGGDGCNPAESCNGIDPECPPDTFLPAGSTCPFNLSNFCTHRECDGTGGCAQSPAAAGTQCRAALPCRPAQFCNGTDMSCDIPPVYPAGTACEPADANPCTLDQCDGSIANFDCEHPLAPNGTSCDDGDPHTLNDSCTGGVCAGSGLSAFKCYYAKDLKDPQFQPTVVTTSDQINGESLELEKPRYLCAPASLDGADVPNPISHLTCYQTKGADLTPRPRIEIDGPLGQGQLELKRAATLCLPSSKTVLP